MDARGAPGHARYCLQLRHRIFGQQSRGRKLPCDPQLNRERFEQRLTINDQYGHPVPRIELQKFWVQVLAAGKVERPNTELSARLGQIDVADQRTGCRA